MVVDLLIDQRRLRAGIRCLLLCAAVLGALSVLAPRARAAGTLTDLGSLQPGCGSTAAAINNRGQVAGTSCREPFRWTAAHGMQGLGFLSTVNPYGGATGINAKGEVAGLAANSVGGGMANVFVWSPAKGIRNLTNDWYPGDTGVAINDAGQVAYTQGRVDGEQTALLWTPGVGLQGVGMLPGGDTNQVGGGSSACCAAALDDHGDVTGVSLDEFGPDPGYHAYLHTPTGGTQDLGVLPGGTGSAGVAVNLHLDVAGDSSNSDGNPEAFVWSPAGGMQGLMLSGATSTVAVDINDRSEVVGNAQLPGGTTEAFLWVPGHGVIALGAGKAVAINQNGVAIVAGSDGNAYRWTASTGLAKLGPGAPTAINDHGQIVGNSTNGDAFLWSPGNRS